MNSCMCDEHLCDVTRRWPRTTLTVACTSTTSSMCSEADHRYFLRITRLVHDMCSCFTYIHTYYNYSTLSECVIVVIIVGSFLPRLAGCHCLPTQQGRIDVQKYINVITCKQDTTVHICRHTYITNRKRISGGGRCPATTGCSSGRCPPAPSPTGETSLAIWTPASISTPCNARGYKIGLRTCSRASPADPRPNRSPPPW